MPALSPVDCCRDHIDALYLLAYLYTGQRHTAEDVVVDAVVSAATRRAITVAEPAAVWHLLAGHVHARGDRDLPGIEAGAEPAVALTRAGLSPRQREALALVGTGRKTHETAQLLGVTATQIHRDLRAGLQCLGTALKATAGPAAWRSSDDG